jgi:hypothetical protein
LLQTSGAPAKEVNPTAALEVGGAFISYLSKLGVVAPSYYLRNLTSLPAVALYTKPRLRGVTADRPAH